MTNGTASETNGIASGITLLPCPFCGGEAVMECDWSRIGFSVMIYCEDDPSMHRMRATYPLLKVEQEEIARESIAASWNRRVAVTDHDFALAVHDGELWRKMEPREPEWEMTGGTQTQEFWECSCAECGHSFGVEDRSSFPFKMTINKVEVPNFCPDCGTPTREVC